MGLDQDCGVEVFIGANLGWGGQAGQKAGDRCIWSLGLGFLGGGCSFVFMFVLFLSIWDIGCPIGMCPDVSFSLPPSSPPSTPFIFLQHHSP